MKKIIQQYLTGERALFQGENLEIKDTVLADGESPLKESSNIQSYGSMFKWKYPLWYSKHIFIKDCTLFEMGRAGIWYTDDITVEDTVIETSKTFRRGNRIALKNVTMPNAEETLWSCNNVSIQQVSAKNLTLINCTVESLQGMCYIENLVMKNCKLINTTLAFEYSKVDVEITGKIDSVMNPSAGVIRAGSIGDLIIESTKVNPNNTTIVLKEEMKDAV